MQVNSTTASQPVQATQVPKKAEAVLERKQNETQEANNVQANKDTVARNEQVQKSQESARTSVNTNGQTVGTRINTSA